MLLVAPNGRVGAAGFLAVLAGLGAASLLASGSDVGPLLAAAGFLDVLAGLIAAVVLRGGVPGKQLGSVAFGKQEPSGGSEPDTGR